MEFSLAGMKYGWKGVKIKQKSLAILEGNCFTWDSMKKYFGFFDGLRGLGLNMTKREAFSASHSGSCDQDVAALVEKPSIASQLDAISPDDIRAGLKESVGWDSEELSDDTQNRHRAVWIAACDIRENWSEK